MTASAKRLRIDTIFTCSLVELLAFYRNIHSSWARTKAYDGQRMRHWGFRCQEGLWSNCGWREEGTDTHGGMHSARIYSAPNLMHHLIVKMFSRLSRLCDVSKVGTDLKFWASVLILVWEEKEEQDEPDKKVFSEFGIPGRSCEQQRRRQ